MAKKITKEQSQYFAARVRDIFNSKCKQIIESYAGMYWPNNGYGQPQAQWANRDKDVGHSWQLPFSCMHSCVVLQDSERDT